MRLFSEWLEMQLIFALKKLSFFIADSMLISRNKLKNSN